MEPFRVIVTGVRYFHDYVRRRALLDHLLSNRLPDVVILSRCGRGTDALATSYAVECGLQLVAYPLNLERDLGDLLGRSPPKGIAAPVDPAESLFRECGNRSGRSSHRDG